MPGRIWGIQELAFGDHWFSDTGAQNSGGIIHPPDTDAYDAGNLPPPDNAAWYAGGASGARHFHAVVDAAGQWWVDVFDRSMTTLLERWEITGWVTVFPAASYEAFFDIQHVTANSQVVVVIADHLDAGSVHDFIGVTVFDLTGTILNQWSIATPDSGFGSTDELSGQTGSCLDDAYVYFGVHDGTTADEDVVSVNLATGALTKLFTIDALDATIEATDPTFLGLGATAGIVEKDGDLIIAGSNGLARAQQDGTPVWWGNITDPLQSYRGLAHSGRNSVWVSQTTNTADEWDYNGVFLQSVTIVEPAIQAWLIQGGIFEYRYRWPQIGPVLTNPAAANLLNERDLELEDFLGDFEYPAHWPDFIAGVIAGDREAIGELEVCDVALEDHLGDFEYVYRWPDIAAAVKRGDSAAWAMLEMRDIALEDHLSA